MPGGGRRPRRTGAEVCGEHVEASDGCGAGRVSGAGRGCRGRAERCAERCGGSGWGRTGVRCRAWL